mgnify:CR=1 FL=1
MVVLLSVVGSGRLSGRGDIGNAPPAFFRLPPIVNSNFSLFKNFRIAERFNTQFRWETFNTFNHTQFGNANTNTQSPTFGAITSTRSLDIHTSPQMVYGPGERALLAWIEVSPSPRSVWLSHVAAKPRT